MKIPLSRPAVILGAASLHTRSVRGEREMLSGSTSPKMRTSLPVSLSRMKNAVLS